MKRKTKCYQITHVAYDADLRPVSKLKPFPKIKVLAFTAIFLYLLLGVLKTQAQIIQLPTNPSGNLPALKRQIIFLNANRALDGLKRSSSDIREAATIIKLTQEVKTSYKPNPLLRTSFGLQPSKGLLYSQIGYNIYTVNNRIDAVNKSYELSLSSGRYTGTYSTPFDTSSYTLMLTTTVPLE